MSFDDFWKAYPKKTGKLYAVQCYQKAIGHGATHDEILTGARLYVEDIKKNETARQFIKDPSTFLNKGCWLDEYDEPEIVRCSPEESLRKARISSYHAKGFWNDDWGPKPESNIVRFEKTA